MKIAIMQPYFMPYAGYFRLFAAVDVFVAFDCVQFPRRGWVHRNRFSNFAGEFQWLTLPLKKGDRDTTRICDLEFQDNAVVTMRDQVQKFRALKSLEQTSPNLSNLLLDLGNDPTQYLVNTLTEITNKLGISRPVVRSSTLNIDPQLKGQERIIAIAQQLGAKNYVNAPGGKEIYDAEAFQKAGLELHFLPEYQGKYSSILERIIEDGEEFVAKEILQSTPSFGA